MSDATQPIAYAMPALPISSPAPSQGTTRKGVLGPTLTRVVEKVWKQTPSTKSDFAKAEADWIAVAASMGLITTMTGPDRFGRKWLVTPLGLTALFQSWDELE